MHSIERCKQLVAEQPEKKRSECVGLSNTTVGREKYDCCSLNIMILLRVRLRRNSYYCFNFISVIHVSLVVVNLLLLLLLWKEAFYFFRRCVFIITMIMMERS